VGEPLYQAVVAALTERMDSDTPPFASMPRVTGGRYGLSSKEVTPGMIRPIFAELATERPKRHFTVGIYDDVTHLSLPIDLDFRSPRPAGEVQAVFFGLGSDGTVGANKASVKIIGEGTDLFAQGYFVYDSKKSGGTTVSHLRFGPEKIKSAYLIEAADFVACHQFASSKDEDPRLRQAGRDVPPQRALLPDESGPPPPRRPQQLIDKAIDFWSIDAFAVASEVGWQPHQHDHAAVLSPSSRVPARRKRDRADQGGSWRRLPKRGQEPSSTATSPARPLHRAARHVELRATASGYALPAVVPADAPTSSGHVTKRRSWPAAATTPVTPSVRRHFPSGTTKLQKRAIPHEIPIWDPSICIDCGKCAMVCPHAAIRMKSSRPPRGRGARGHLSKEFKSRDLLDHRRTIQVAPDDSNRCGVWPTSARQEQDGPSTRTINMERPRTHPTWSGRAGILPFDPDAWTAVLIAHTPSRAPRSFEPLSCSRCLQRCGETPSSSTSTHSSATRISCQRPRAAPRSTRQPPTTPDGQRRGRGPDRTTRSSRTNAEFGSGLPTATTPRPPGPRLLSASPLRWARISSVRFSTPPRHRCGDRPSSGPHRRLRVALGRVDAISPGRPAPALPGPASWSEGSLDTATTAGPTTSATGPGPSPEPAERQRPRPRHRRSTQHASGVEGDATRRGGQFAAARKSRGTKDLGAVAPPTRRVLAQVAMRQRRQLPRHPRG